MATANELSWVVGSDIDRDGMYLEVSQGTSVAAEIFYSDVTSRMTITLWKEDVELELVEELIARARLRLPPTVAVTLLPKED